MPGPTDLIAYLAIRVAPPAIAVAILATGSPLTAQATAGTGLAREIDRRATQIEAKAIAWRRDIHQHPELSNREVRTSRLVADHLRSLGIESALASVRRVSSASYVEAARDRWSPSAPTWTRSP